MSHWDFKLIEICINLLFMHWIYWIFFLQTPLSRTCRCIMLGHETMTQVPQGFCNIWDSQNMFPFKSVLSFLHLPTFTMKLLKIHGRCPYMLWKNLNGQRFFVHTKHLLLCKYLSSPSYLNWWLFVEPFMVEVECFNQPSPTFGDETCL